MASVPVTFRQLIAENKRNSLILVIIFCLFNTALALVLGIAALAYIKGVDLAKLDWVQAAALGGLGAGLALMWSFLSYYVGDDMVLAVSGARPIEHDDDPELFNVVEEMAIAAGVPMPKVYLIHDPAPNAFATGRDPAHATVAITSGLRSKLTRDELQGVIAHEMSHIANFDIRLMLLMAMLVGTVVMLCDLFWQILRFGPGRGSRKDGEKSGGPLVLVLIIVGVVLAIIAPILAQIIQLAVSRQREYLADATAVQLTRYPLGLANALRKIDADPHEMQNANRGTAHLYIDNPIEKFEARANSPFASHPPIQDRIRRLELLARQMSGPAVQGQA
jgi:heat shock protein HtpX